jgi:3-phenylpropionate/cinnamic acid dioxygenase small subunit
MNALESLFKQSQSIGSVCVKMNSGECLRLKVNKAFQLVEKEQTATYCSKTTYKDYVNSLKKVEKKNDTKEEVVDTKTEEVKQKSKKKKDN